MQRAAMAINEYLVILSSWRSSTNARAILTFSNQPTRMRQWRWLVSLLANGERSPSWRARIQQRAQIGGRGGGPISSGISISSPTIPYFRGWLVPEPLESMTPDAR
jgi:hypothetical protein